MGIIALFVYIVIVALIGYLAVWALGQLAPEHPKLIDNVIWVVVVLVIVLALAQAFGLSAHDPAVPRLR